MNFSKPNSLDPGRLGGNPAFQLHKNLYESLVAFDDDWKTVVGGLAASYTVSDDAREYAFKMRPGVTYHDGEPVDAASIKTNLEYGAKSGNLAAGLVPNFSRIDASDPMTLKITLKQGMPDLPGNLSWIALTSPKAIARGGDAMNRAPVGSGPFRFVSVGVDGTVVLEGYEDYHGEGPYLERLEFPVISDPNAQIAAFRSGKVDLVRTVSPIRAREMSSVSEVQILSASIWSPVCVFMHCVEPFDDLRVRQAVAHAIDAQAILDGPMLGEGTLNTSNYPSTLPGHIDPKTAYPHNIDKAKALLAEAGYPDGVKIDMAVIAGASQVNGEDNAQAIAAQLREAGIDPRLQPLDEAVFNAESGKDTSRFKLFYGALGWIDGAGFHYTQHVMSQYLTKFKGKELPALETEYATTPNGPERVRLLAQVQEEHAKEALFVPLFDPKELDVVRSNVRGYSPPRDSISPRFAQTYLA